MRKDVGTRTIATLYESHTWVRLANWGGLLVGGILLIWLPGGFPPWVWRALVQYIAQAFHLWALRGPAMLAPLIWLLIQSLFWLAAWGVYLWSALYIVRLWRHYRDGQQQFKQELAGVLQRLDAQDGRGAACHLPIPKIAQKGRVMTSGQESWLKARDGRVMASEGRAMVGEGRVMAGEAGTMAREGRAMTSIAPTLARPSPTPDLPTRPPVTPAKPDGMQEGNGFPRGWRQQLALGLEFGSGWDAGITRKHDPNEDSLVCLQGYCIYNDRLSPFGLCVVADGMGGHADGQDASYLAVQAVLRSVLPNIAGSSAMEDELLPELLAEGIQQANDAVYKRSQKIGVNMGSTITAALILDKTAYVANVGDSRTYLYRPGAGISQVTRDHSLVARLVEAGRIAHDEVYTHPNRNQIYRGLGDRGAVQVDCFTVPLQEQDCLLLCSDGLWEMVRDPQIERILKQFGSYPTQASRLLVRAALEGGGKDNISVIVVHANPIAA